MIRLLLTTSLLLALPCSAAFEEWTNKEGKTVSMNLVSTTGEGDAIVGKFRMLGGQLVTVKGSDLNAAGLEKLKSGAVKLKEAAAGGGGGGGGGGDSVFDKIFKDNLLKVEGDKLVPATPSKPKKYYIFYYTAKWCGPCQAFTPGLVDFYNKNKSGNDNFEVVAISWDHSQADLADYATHKKMPWQVLKLSAVGGFQQKHNHGIQGIPAVVVCDLEGNIVANTRDLAELEKLVK